MFRTAPASRPACSRLTLPHTYITRPLLAVQDRCRLAITRNAKDISTNTLPATYTVAEPLQTWLASREVERTVKLDVVAEGKGQAIVVVDVEPDSAAAQAGIVKGQKVVGISDPVRDSEVWKMDDRPSLRFVRDTLRMRRMGRVQLLLIDYLNVTDPAWSQPATKSPGPESARQQDAASDGSSSDDGSNFQGSTALDSMLSEGEEEGGGMTLGERMAAQYEARMRQDQQVTEVKKRIARRAAYMDEVSQRNDSPLVIGALLAFLGPALIILAVAAGTGYLDKLYSSSITLR